MSKWFALFGLVLLSLEAVLLSLEFYVVLKRTSMKNYPYPLWEKKWIGVSISISPFIDLKGLESQ